MSLTLQSALNHFKTHFLDVEIQAIKGTKFCVFNRKVDFGLFSSVPKSNWYMDSKDDFALIFSALYLVFKSKISFLVKFDSKV